jgi:hypothetical protein
MRTIIPVILGVAVVAACSSFEDAAPGPTPPGSDGGSEASGNDSGNDGGVDCVPEPEPNNACGPKGEIVDVTSSTEHCGFCNHSCGTTSCVNGACEAAEVASADEMVVVRPRATKGTDLYIATNQSGCSGARTMRVSLTSGAAQNVFTAPGPACTREIIVHGEDLYYWHGAAGIFRASTTSTADPGTNIIGTASVSALHLTKDALFYAVAKSGIRRTDFNGQNEIPVHDSTSVDLQLFAGDDDAFFWLTGPSSGDPLTKQTLSYREGTSGSNVSRLSNLSGITKMTLDDADIFLVRADGEVLRAPKKGSIDPEVVGRVGVPGLFTRGVGVAGDYVYLAMGKDPVNSDSSPFELYRMKKRCGGTARLVARGYLYTNALVPIDGFLYYGDVGKLRRLALP